MPTNYTSAPVEASIHLFAGPSISIRTYIHGSIFASTFSATLQIHVGNVEFPWFYSVKPSNLQENLRRVAPKILEAAGYRVFSVRVEALVKDLEAALLPALLLNKDEAERREAETQARVAAVEARHAALEAEYRGAILRRPVVQDVGVDLVKVPASGRDIEDALHRGGVRGRWTTLQSYNVGLSAGLSTEVYLPLEGLAG